MALLGFDTPGKCLALKKVSTASQGLCTQNSYYSLTPAIELSLAENTMHVMGLC